MRKYSESLYKCNSFSHISIYSYLLFNGNMKTIDEIRRANLELAIKKARTAASLASLIQTAPAYLSQIRNAAPDSKTGTPKTMGDDLARRIEAALGIGAGWMDMDHSGETKNINGLPKSILTRVDSNMRPPRLQLITDEEADLLHEYRMMAEKEKNMLMAAATSLPKITLLGISSADQL